MWNTWQCHCFSVVLKATHETSQGPLKGALSAQKRVKKDPKESLGGSQSELCFPNEGSLIRTPSKSRIFLPICPPKVWLSAPVNSQKPNAMWRFEGNRELIYPPVKNKTFSSMSVADGVSLHDIIASILVFPCWKLWLKTMASDKLLNSANFFSGGLPSCFGIVSTKIDQAD